MASAHAGPALLASPGGLLASPGGLLASPGGLPSPADLIENLPPPFPLAVCHRGTPAAADGAHPAAWLPPLVEAGEVLPFAIELPPQARAVAYLPGLDAARVPLAFDRAQRVWRGALAVPAGAPRLGHFTLRIVAASGDEYDVRVPLGIPQEPTTLSL